MANPSIDSLAGISGRVCSIFRTSGGEPVQRFLAAVFGTETDDKRGDREGGTLMSAHYDRDEAVKPVIRSVRTHTSSARGGRVMMHTSDLYAAFRIATSGRCLRPEA